MSFIDIHCKSNDGKTEIHIYIDGDKPITVGCYGHPSTFDIVEFVTLRSGIDASYYVTDLEEHDQAWSDHRNSTMRLPQFFFAPLLAGLVDL
ncbi:hypothetical protein UFOVP75_199 [uncultured Caudovirales phage]|uniref:Uncharacterized protein n=1 Tax=uncultured Caudovirales phage TaxID=2100421 RepID=A0A6J5L2L0_9CAUD|nr:hypothetical protein UFOVP75_199 [uncultured Caudovirales phage]